VRTACANGLRDGPRERPVRTACENGLTDRLGDRLREEIPFAGQRVLVGLLDDVTLPSENRGDRRGCRCSDLLGFRERARLRA